MLHLERMRRRVAALKAIRHFFDDAGFLEVDTPVAISAPAPEPHIETARVVLHTDTTEHVRYLQPSPELPMKRLLAAGFERLYQIAVVFRDGELSPTHRPEFRLLEWYRAHSAWEVLLADCEGLLRAVATALGELQITYAGQTIDLSRPFRRVSVNEAFEQHAGFAILDALDTEALRQRARALDLHTEPSDSWNDLFHRIFLARVEPSLLRDPQPLFLTDYPAPLSALAQLSCDDLRVAERFELFVGGLELANGFGELTDAAEQRRRFLSDARDRAARGMHAYPIDERFLAALQHMPPASGIALGIERLLMLVLDATLDEVAFIPWSQV